jgi:hypothetical protein
MHFEKAACLPLSVSNSENSPNGSLEQEIGAVVAALVGTMCRGLLERQGGQMHPETRRYGSELICKLIPFKLCVPDFDVIARKYGAEVLREHVAASPRPNISRVGMMPGDRKSHSARIAISSHRIWLINTIRNLTPSLQRLELHDPAAKEFRPR